MSRSVCHVPRAVSAADRAEISGFWPIFIGNGFACIIAIPDEMTRAPLAIFAFALAAATGVITLVGQEPRTPPAPPADPYRFKSGVELINVTATVFDRNGRFVPGLTRDDFMVYEDDSRQEIAQFSAERVPVSLGIVLDTSGSMVGEKIDAARGALDR